MKGTKEGTISVLIPAFNAESVIKETLASVLNQTMPPDEIIVLDDGSSDNTVGIVETFAPRVKLVRQANKGHIEARNILFRLAKGDLIACLDHDDLWHPKYLEVQYQMSQRYPNAVIYYTAFENIKENQRWAPKEDALLSSHHALIKPKEFLLKYNKACGFILPSFCVFRGEVLRQLSGNLFPDVYLWYRLALVGPFAESGARLGGYRLVQTSLSSDRLWAYKKRLEAMQQIVELYTKVAPTCMLKVARDFLAASYRLYGKHLMGVGDVTEARRVFKAGLRRSFRMKTLILLVTTFLPTSLQPKWPQRQRVYPFKSTKTS